MGSRALVREADVQRRIQQKIGQGEGIEYSGWIRKHDFSSKGFARELLGVRIPRSFHLLSNLEHRVFLMLEWVLRILDIREQFPLLDRDLMLTLAARLGIRPPLYRVTRVPFVMTTDFLVTVQTPEGSHLVALSIKPAEMLTKRRTFELLMLERAYWQEQGVEWRLVTDREIPYSLPRNIHWLRQRAFLDPEISDRSLHETFLRVLPVYASDTVPLRTVLSNVSRRMGISPELSCSLFKYNAWHQRIWADYSSPVRLPLPLAGLRLLNHKPAMPLGM